MSTESAVDLAKKYITLQQEFANFNNVNRAESIGGVKDQLNSNSNFFHEFNSKNDLQIQFSFN